MTRTSKSTHCVEFGSVCTNGYDWTSPASIDVMAASGKPSDERLRNRRLVVPSQIDQSGTESIPERSLNCRKTRHAVFFGMRWNLLATLMLSSLAFAAGCQSRSRPATNAISGKVTIEGQPVSGVLVVFTPTEPNSVGATALVTNGEYSLSPEFGPSKGTLLVSFTPKQPDLEDFETLRMVGEAPLSTIEIPERFLQPFELKIEVTETQTNTFDFDLRFE